jgi:hypothetical protein
MWPSIFCDTGGGEDFSSSASASVARYHRWPGRPGIGCGSSSPSSPSTDTTITINCSGVSPVEVHVPIGSRVSFLNTDARPHAMSSDPIQAHTDCPPINQVGFLNPGQRGTTGMLDVNRTCGVHDHTNENDAVSKDVSSSNSQIDCTDRVSAYGMWAFGIGREQRHLARKWARTRGMGCAIAILGGLRSDCAERAASVS